MTPKRGRGVAPKRGRGVAPKGERAGVRSKGKATGYSNNILCISLMLFKSLIFSGQLLPCCFTSKQMKAFISLDPGSSRAFFDHGRGKGPLPLPKLFRFCTQK